MATVTGIELWTDVACNGNAGGRRTHFALDELLVCVSTEALAGEEGLTFAVWRDDPRAAEIIRGHVARVVTTDSTVFTEWRIADLEDGGTGEDATLMVRCLSIQSDLVRAISINTDDPLNPAHDYELVDGTVEDVLDGPVRDALDAIGLDWIVTGTVEPQLVFDQSGDYETCTQMIAQATSPEKGGGEFQLVRFGAVNYQMNVLDQVGADADTLYLRTARNLTSLRRRRLLADSATRVVVKGVQDATGVGISHAFWRVSAVDTGNNTVSLEDPRTGWPAPIRFDNQFVLPTTMYLARIGVTFASTEILQCTPGSPNMLVDDASIFQVGDYAEFRTASGANAVRVYALDHPASQIANAGAFTRILDRSSISGVVNYVPNGDASTWTDTGTPAEPDGWTSAVVSGGGSITKLYETTITQFGGASFGIARASGLLNPAVIRSPAIAVYDDAAYTWRFWVWLYIDASYVGSVKVRTVRADTHATIETLYDSTVSGLPTLGEWVLYELDTANTGTAGGGLKLQIEMVVSSLTAPFYVDAFGCQPASWERTDVYGPFSTVSKCANDLWHEGQDYLEVANSPAVYDCQAIDLEQIDGSAFPEEAVTVGQTAVIYDTQLNLTTTQRVLSVTRDYLAKTMQLRFGSAYVAYSQVLAQKRRIAPRTPKEIDEVALAIADGLDRVKQSSALLGEFDYEATILSGGSPSSDITLITGEEQAGQLAALIRRSRGKRVVV